ncbi:MAG: ABC transporter ATP-binding protein/permease, partial [Betaproteobacteria bacterium]
HRMNLTQPNAWRDLWALIHAYWWSEEKVSARLLLFAIVALTLGMVYMNVQINLWQNHFFNALQDKNQQQFYHQLIRFLGLAAIWVVLSVYSQYLTQMLQVRWRRWLTDDYLRRWLADRAYYRMQFAGAQTDNPDQRIAEDLRLFVEGSVSLFVGLLNAAVTLASFIGILWVLSGPLSLHIGTMTLVIPGYIVWIAVVYALAGDWIAHQIGKALIALNFKQQGAEADFRYSLVRFRDNMEGVALYDGEADELSSFRTRFASVFSNWWAIMRRQKRLAWFTASYSQTAVVVPFIVAAPRYFAGTLQLGGLMQTASAFGYVRDALTWFINAYVAFATWKAAVDRLTTFHNEILAAQEAQRSTPGVQVIEGASPDLQFEKVKLDRPSGDALLTLDALDIVPGSRVLIRGPSGSGKSTLLRAIAGIWPFGRGVIKRPRDFNALFLPQAAYFPLGSLREAMCYPTPCNAFSETQVKDALESVGLSHLITRLDESANWTHALSGADQQRVAFARVLLQKPKWLFLDEATSSLDEGSQAALYDLLISKLPDTTMISTAGGEELAGRHLQTWALNARGSAFELQKV